MFRIIPFFIFIIDVLCVIDVIKSSMANDKKILWVVVIVFLPVVGPILYFLLGRK